MIRVHVICEGQTEEAFIKKLLVPSLAQKNIYLNPFLIGKPEHKGGNYRLERLLNDLKPILLGEKNSYCTTLFDFYGLPESFPGKRSALSANAIQDKATRVCDALISEVKKELVNNHAVDTRFIPYVQMYEFEALLFSNPILFAQGINRKDLSQSFAQIRTQFESPEHINNSTNTAPSKRIGKLYSAYKKPKDGVLAALEIGLNNILSECALFNQWYQKLANLKPL